MRKSYLTGAKKQSFTDIYFGITSLEDNNTIGTEIFTLEQRSGTYSYTRRAFTSSDQATFNIEYSLDNIHWNQFNSTITLNTNEVVFFRGNNDQLWLYDGSSYSKWTSISFYSDKTVNVSGKISSLFNGTERKVYDKKLSGAPGGGAFTLSIFCNARWLASDPLTIDWHGLKIVNANNLTINVERPYAAWLFFYNTTLVTPPKLPAGELVQNSYIRMFYLCESLNKLPKLPAITLTNDCYNEMFGYCNNICISETRDSTYINEYRIPITGTGTQANRSVYNMFIGTDGTFKGTPNINTVYYTSNEVI